MDALRAKQDAAAQRYRLQARLTLIAKVAKARGDAPASIEATGLRKAVDAVKVGEREVTTNAAVAALTAIAPQVDALQTRLGIGSYAAPLVPKWLRFLTWTAPLLLALLGGVIWFSLVRRKRVVDAAALARLDAEGAPPRNRS